MFPAEGTFRKAHLVCLIFLLSIYVLIHACAGEQKQEKF